MSERTLGRFRERCSTYVSETGLVCSVTQYEIKKKGNMVLLLI